MGLSLTADVVGWVLVDVDAGGLLDHDVLEVTAGAEFGGAAELGAHAIAATAGNEIDRVRITWSDDAAHDGLRLQSRLRSLALSPVEAVPQSRALAVLVGTAVGEVQSCHVHAGVNQLGDTFRAAAGGAEGGDDLGAAQ